MVTFLENPEVLAAAENTVGKVCCAWESLEEDQMDSALGKRIAHFKTSLKRIARVLLFTACRYWFDNGGKNSA